MLCWIAPKNGTEGRKWFTWLRHNSQNNNLERVMNCESFLPEQLKPFRLQGRAWRRLTEPWGRRRKSRSGWKRRTPWRSGDPPRGSSPRTPGGPKSTTTTTTGPPGLTIRTDPSPARPSICRAGAATRRCEPPDRTETPPRPSVLMCTAIRSVPPGIALNGIQLCSFFFFFVFFFNLFVSSWA